MPCSYLYQRKETAAASHPYLGFSKGKYPQVGICAGGGFRESLPGFSLLPMPSRSQIPSRASLKLRCVIVEDQVLFEQLLRLTLESVGLVDVVAVAHTAKEGIAAVREHLPDLLLLDLALPDKSGPTVATELAKCRPEARIIIVSGEADTFQCPRHLRPHIYSVVDKTRALGVVLQEIAVLRDSLMNLEKNAGAKGINAQALSPREIEILELIGQGLSNKEIAARSGISLHTAETHRKHIAAKLGVSGAELISHATIRSRTIKLASAGE
jgi:DNA-binding NarL/FixJ family response regulator